MEDVRRRSSLFLRLLSILENVDKHPLPRARRTPLYIKLGARAESLTEEEEEEVGNLRCRKQRCAFGVDVNNWYPKCKTEGHMVELTTIDVSHTRRSYCLCLA